MTRAQVIGQVLTFTLTFAMKLAGLAVALDQLFLHSTTKPIILALAAFMMAGAQLTEAGLLAFLDRLGIGQLSTRKPAESQPSAPAEPPP